MKVRPERKGETTADYWQAYPGPQEEEVEQEERDVMPPVMRTFQPISDFRWRTVFAIIYVAGFKIVDVITKSISTQSIITAITSIKVAVSMNVDQVTISIVYQ